MHLKRYLIENIEINLFRKTAFIFNYTHPFMYLFDLKIIKYNTLFYFLNDNIFEWLSYLSNQGFFAGIAPSCSPAPLFLASDSNTIRALLLYGIFSERITHKKREVKDKKMCQDAFKFHRKKNKQIHDELV